MGGEKVVVQIIGKVRYHRKTFTFYVEYTIKTEGMINGKRGQLDYQSGNYTTTEVL